MDLKKSDVVEERVRESCSAEGKVKGKVRSVNLRKMGRRMGGYTVHEGKVKSVSRESVSETTDRVSREFREAKRSEMHRLRIVGSIPCVVLWV